MQIENYGRSLDVPPLVPLGRRIEEIIPNTRTWALNERAGFEHAKKLRESGRRVDPIEEAASGQNNPQSEAERQAQLAAIREKIRNLPLAG